MESSVERQIAKTYHRLRVGMTVMGFLLPLVLWGGGWLLHHISLLNSMSAYYHSPMREFFTGILIAVGFCLFIYRGFSDKENIIFNFAGLLVMGVAIFPCAGEASGRSIFSGLVETKTLAIIHGCCAVTFFALIAWVCGVFGKTSMGAIPNDSSIRFWNVTLTKETLNNLYNAIATAMVVFPVTSSIILWMHKGTAHVFFWETFGVLSFAAYWFLKTLEIMASEADRKLPHGGRKDEADSAPQHPRVRLEPISSVEKKN